MRALLIFLNIHFMVPELFTLILLNTIVQESILLYNK